MEDKIFKADAKQIVDMVFDNKLFKDSITRDHMNEFEHLIAFLLTIKYEGYVRTKSLMDRVSSTGSSPREVFIVQADDLMIHGCFSNKDSADKYIDGAKNLHVHKSTVA